MAEEIKKYTISESELKLLEMYLKEIRVMTKAFELVRGESITESNIIEAIKETMKWLTTALENTIKRTRDGN